MPTLQQDKGPTSKDGARATVTGVDSRGQLFRDTATIVFLKGRKCIYQSKVRPSPDSELMIEIQNGKETWRSNAKVRSVSSVGTQPGTFSVTVELDRAHSTVIETPNAEEALSNAEEPTAAPKAVRQASVVPAIQEAAKPDPSAVLLAVPSPSAASNESAPRSSASAAADPASLAPPSMPTPVPKMMVADIVRSVMASDLGQLKRELQGAVANQLEAALREPFETLETKIEQRLRQEPAITEDSVRQIAAQAAENAQIEWAGAKLQKMMAEAVRSALASNSEQRRQEVATLVCGEIEAALRGPITARMDSRLEEHSRKRPSITEDTVRQVATQVAEHVQLEWASTRLRKMMAEAVHSALASDDEQRRAEMAALVSTEIEAALRGPVAAQINATIEKTLETKIGQHFQTRPAIEELQKTVVNAVRQLLEAEYEQRGRQVQAVVSSEIEAAVRGPIATQMDEMLKKALEAQRAEYLRAPPPITEETVRKLVAGVAEHPQFKGSMDALAATLSERWTEVARGVTSTAQQDINSRIAATERLAGQVVLDIREKLNSFSAEMNRIFEGHKEDSAASSPGGSQEADLQEREKRFREVLQTTGSQFEREMKAALKKIFGKS